jgi:hypothetical protein
VKLVIRLAVLVAALLMVGAAVAYAQTPPPAANPPGSRLVIEKWSLVAQDGTVLASGGEALPTPPTSVAPTTTTTGAPSPTTTSAPTTTAPPPAPTTTTTTAPPAGAITNGQQVNAANTGINAGGVTSGQLVSRSGGTFTAAGQVFDRQRFTSPVVLSGTDQVIRNSVIEVPSSTTVRALRLLGSRSLIENTMVRVTGSGGYICVDIAGGSNHTLRRVDVSNCENAVSSYQSGTSITESYLHDPHTPKAGAHHDVLEVYGGSISLTRSRLTMVPDETAVVNVAPWGSASVSSALIADNYINGGNFHVIMDNQASGIRFAQVVRNRFGGNTNFGGYLAYRAPDSDDPPIVRSQNSAGQNSVYWPNSGANVNTWHREGSSPTVSRDGQTVS